MCQPQAVHDDALHGLVALVVSRWRVAVEEVLQELVEVVGQEAQKLLVVKPRVVKVHLRDDQVSEEREQWVRPVCRVPLVHDEMLDELLLGGEHLRPVRLGDFAGGAVGALARPHVLRGR